MSPLLPCLLLLAGAVGSTADDRAAAVPSHADLVYLEEDGVHLEADIYRPRSEGPHPVVMLIHGGAFHSGHRRHPAQVAWVESLVERGVAVVSPSYRLVDAEPESTAFPTPVQDLKCAVQWFRRHGERYGLDTEKIVAIGGSAGGYFAAMLATTGDSPELRPRCPDAPATSNAIRGAVVYYGIWDWAPLMDQRRGGEVEVQLAHEMERRFVGSDCTSPTSREGLCRRASPLGHLDGADAPVLLLHSRDDPAIPVAQSRDAHKALEGAGIPTTYLEIDGVGHGWMGRLDQPSASAAQEQVLRWIDEQLR